MLSCSTINCTINASYNANLTFQIVLADDFKVSVENKPFPRTRIGLSIFAGDILSDLSYLPAIQIYITEGRFVTFQSSMKMLVSVHS